MSTKKTVRAITLIFLCVVASLCIVLSLNNSSYGKENSVKGEIDGSVVFKDVDNSPRAFEDGLFKINITDTTTSPQPVAQISVAGSDTGEASWKLDGGVEFTTEGIYTYEISQTVKANHEGTIVTNEVLYNVEFKVDKELNIEKTIKLNDVKVDKVVFNNRLTNLNIAYDDAHENFGPVVVGENINYVAQGMNYNATAQDLVFAFNMADCLSTDYEGFHVDVVDNLGNVVPYTIKFEPQFGHTSMTITVANAPVDRQYTIKFSAKATLKKAEELAYVADVGFTQNGMSGGSVSNALTTTNYADDHTLGQPLKIGDKINYQVVTTQASTDGGDIVFEGIGKGLTYDKTSFVCNDKDVSESVELTESGFKYKVAEVPYRLILKLSFTCTVIDSGIVQSDSLVNNYKLNSLYNSVPGSAADKPAGSTFVAGTIVTCTIKGDNLTDNPISVGFDAKTDDGLDILLDSGNTVLTYGQEQYVLTDEEMSQSDPHHLNIPITTNMPQVPAQAHYSLTYKCYVSEDLTFAQIDPAIIFEEQTIELPQEKYSISKKDYADGHTSKDVLSPGENIAYALYSGNNTDKTCNITFTDTVESGLSYDEESFILKIDDAEVAVKPTITDQQFSVVVADVPAGSKVELDYACKVADNVLHVNNNAKVSIATFDPVQLNQLDNAVKTADKKSDEVTGMSKTNDNLKTLLSAMLLIVGACAYIVFKKRIRG